MCSGQALAGLRSSLEDRETHLVHQPAYPLAARAPAVPAQMACHLARAIQRHSINCWSIPRRNAFGGRACAFIRWRSPAGSARSRLPFNASAMSISLWPCHRSAGVDERRGKLSLFCRTYLGIRILGTTVDRATDISDQREILDFLSRGAAHVETHSAHVFLTGQIAIKLKEVDEAALSGFLKCVFAPSGIRDGTRDQSALPTTYTSTSSQLSCWGQFGWDRRHWSWTESLERRSSRSAAFSRI